MSTDIPLWVAVVIGLGPSVVAVVTLLAADWRDRRRITHEREMRLRDERIEAYRKLLTATTNAHVDREAELGIKGRTAGFRDLEGSSTDE